MRKFLERTSHPSGNFAHWIGLASPGKSIAKEEHQYLEGLQMLLHLEGPGVDSCSIRRGVGQILNKKAILKSDLERILTFHPNADQAVLERGNFKR